MEDLVNDYWRNKRVFVTGYNGFVGSWLTNDLLKSGAVVFGLHKQTIPNHLLDDAEKQHLKIIKGDLRNLDQLREIILNEKIDTVFHLGAQAIVGDANSSPINTFETNIQGTWNLLEACRLSEDIKRVVVFTSDKAYGSSEIMPYKENHELKGRHPYDVSKSCSDLIAQSYYHTYQLPLAVVRCCNIYGGGDLNFNRIIPETIQALLSNNPIIIRSDGKAIREYIYVQDVVNALLLLGKNLDREEIRGEAFNAGSGDIKSVLDVVAAVKNKLGQQDIEVEILNQARNEIYEQYLDSSKIKNLIGWQPTYNFNSGLKLTIDWYKAFFTDSVKVQA